MFKVKIFTVDHYMTKPQPTLDSCYSHFRGKEVKHLPILRIFGSTEQGAKCCLHVHGVFPYFYVPYNGETSRVTTYRHQLALGLDKALNIALGHAESHEQHVFDVIPVAAFPLYGYHSKKHQFLKIQMYNPYLIRKAGQLLQNGAILDTIFQPYEIHINYELQFMIDYNLHGMNFIELRHVTFRVDINDSTVLNDVNEPASSSAGPSNTDQVEKNDQKKMSTCRYEMDCHARDITNINSVSATAKNPGIADIWAEEAARLRKKYPDREHTEHDAQNAHDMFANVQQSQSRDTEHVNAYYLRKFRERIEHLHMLDVNVGNDDVTLSDSNSHTDQNHPNRGIYPCENDDDVIGVEQNSGIKFLNVSLSSHQESHVTVTHELDEDLKCISTQVNEQAIVNMSQLDLYAALVALEAENAENNLPDNDSVLSQYVDVRRDDESGDGNVDLDVENDVSDVRDVIDVNDVSDVINDRRRDECGDGNVGVDVGNDGNLVGNDSELIAEMTKSLRVEDFFSSDELPE